VSWWHWLLLWLIASIPVSLIFGAMARFGMSDEQSQFMAPRRARTINPSARPNKPGPYTSAASRRVYGDGQEASGVMPPFS